MAKTIQELREDRTHAILSAKDIVTAAEGRLLTADEQKSSDDWLTKAEAIDVEIEAVRADDARRARIAGAVQDLGNPNPRKAPPQAIDSAPAASAERERIVPISRYSSLKAFKGKDADYNAYLSGMWLVDTLFPQSHGLKRVANSWCREHGVHNQIQNALSTGVPSAGGNLVPDVLAQTIIDLREQYAIFRQWCDVFPMTSDVQIIPRRSGSATPYWTSENVAITASQPSFDNVQLTAKKLACLTYISSELTEDAIVNIADWVAMDIGKQFAYEEDRVGFNGTAIATDGQINGLFNKATEAGSAGSFVVITSTHNTAAEIDNTDITTIMGALPQYARSGSAFFCSQSMADNVFGRLKAVAGGNSIDTLAMAGITALGQRGIVGSYLGYPIVASQVLPASSATLTNNPIMAFGNLALAATLGERRVIRFATDASIKFAEDQIGIKATARLDINVHDLGTASVAGPIIVMKGGSS